MDKETSPQDVPAICEYSGLRPVEGYIEKTYCYIHDRMYNEDNLCDKCLEENNK